jgi:PAS domain-containing protein
LAIFATVKKAPLVITLIIVLALIGGYYLYERILNKQVFTIAMLVPSNAVFVYEGGLLTDIYTKWKDSPIGKSFEASSFIQGIDIVLNDLDTLIKSNQNQEFVGSKSMLISMHVISKDDFDFIYYFRLDQNDTRVLLQILDKLEKGKYSISESNYEGIPIKEIKLENGTLSFILHEGYFICSKTPFLIEDVVRTIKGGSIQNFFTTNDELIKLPRLQNDEGNLYLNMDQVFKWLGIYAADLKAFENLKSFGKSGLLDVKLTTTGVVLDGFIVPHGKGKDYLNIFDDQQINQLGVKRYIPSRAALVVHLGISNMPLFRNDLRTFLQNNKPNLLDSATNFSKKYNFDLDRFYNWAGNDVSLCVAELYGSNAQKIIYIKANEINEGLNQFNSLADKISIAKDDSVFIDVYGDYQIREIGVKDFPEKLFGIFFGGFDRTYYTTIDDYFILSDDLNGLKSLLSDVEFENTWGHSINWNSFIETTLQESHLSVYINTGRAWNIMLPQLNERWRNFAVKNQQSFLSIEKAALQFNRVDDRYFTNLIFKHNSEASSLIKKNLSFSSIRETIFSNQIRSKPFVVRNHNDNSLEILLQDSSNTVYLISSIGEILWNKQINSPIIGKVEQVDIYRNTKLQYFFASANGQVHLIDRLGRYIENYPFSAPSAEIDFAAVVDYDNSKRYRWLLTSSQGDIFMYDKDANNLVGWNPNRTDAPLSSAAKHYRVRGRDYILAIQERGKILIYNRRGERLSGFPIELDTRLGDELFLIPGADQANTLFTIISKEGLLVKFNLNGQVVSREQLFKPSRDSRFKMIIEKQSKSYIIMRQEGGRLTLMDENGKEIFQKDYISSLPLTVQYYDFGSGRKIYTVTDKEQELSYLYDQTGTLVNQQPFESIEAPAITFSEHSGKYTVYNAISKKLQVFVF